MNETAFIVISLIAGIICGIIFTALRYRGKVAALQERGRSLEEGIGQYRNSAEAEKNRVISLSSELSAIKADRENFRIRLEEQKKELEEMQNRLKTEFENLASKILEDKSRRFTEQNRENLTGLLDPLREKINEFERKISDVYNEENKERSALREQIKMLRELNRQMSEDANNLTKALKGDTKTQGTWGELILERILEVSGLERGREFEIQQSVRNEDGKLLRPDVIVNLPEDKKIIIDSKVSLTAYEAFVNCDSDDERNEFLRQHILSVRNHLKNLSPKNYHSLYGASSLDFVIMFIPVEPAFSLALGRDSLLWEEAFSKNIVISSPATLLAILRTVSGIWRQEKRVKYAEEIAKKGGELYDRIAAFIDEMIKVGDRIDSSKKHYTEAMKKLYEGRKNIVSAAEELKQMGVPASKSIDQRLIGRIQDREEGKDNQLNLLG